LNTNNDDQGKNVLKNVIESNSDDSNDSCTTITSSDEINESFEEICVQKV
jgi:hypothetical protein